MTPSLEAFIESKRNSGEKILSIYLTAGYPTIEATLPIMNTLVDAGADLIEVGVPFSDPLADGLTIQASSKAALENKISLKKIFDLLSEFQPKKKIPLILMGYSNPFLNMGWEILIQQSIKSGVSGFIIPDLPPDESLEVREKFRNNGMDLVYLVAPNTPSERQEKLDQLSGAFIYAVSLTGVTGTRNEFPKETLEYLINLRKRTKKSILVGFGISNKVMATAISPYCDGIIIGSAIINLLSESKDLGEAKEKVYRFVSEMKKSLQNNS